MHAGGISWKICSYISPIVACANWPEKTEQRHQQHQHHLISVFIKIIARVLRVKSCSASFKCARAAIKDLSIEIVLCGAYYIYSELLQNLYRISAYVLRYCILQLQFDRHILKLPQACNARIVIIRWKVDWFSEFLCDPWIIACVSMRCQSHEYS